jgi:hypothetical protein
MARAYPAGNRRPKMITAIALDDHEPPEIADQSDNVTLKPETRAEPEQCWPLKGLARGSASYEVLRRAFARGDLPGRRVGGRIFATEAAVAAWMAATGRGKL